MLFLCNNQLLKLMILNPAHITFLINSLSIETKKKHEYCDTITRAIRRYFNTFRITSADA